MRATSGDPYRLSRRAMIRGLATGLAALGPIAAACTGGPPAGEPTAQPTPEPTAAPASASAPSPAAAKPTARAAASPTAPPPTPAATPTARPTATPFVGPKVVNVGISQEPDSLAAWPGGLFVTALAQNLIFSSLVGVNDKVDAFPDLAEQVPTLENGGARYVGEGEARQLQVTFKIRRDAKWSNGDPVTSQDVKFTWDLMMNPESGAAIGTERKYEKVETPDPQTAVFTFMSQKSARAAAVKDPVALGDLAGQTGPVVDPLYLFGLPSARILPSKVLGPLVEDSPRESHKVAEVLSRGEFARKPIGSGPYTAKEWVPATSLTFQARRDYFRGSPKVETITLRVLPKRDVLLAELGAGQLHLISQGALEGDVGQNPGAIAGAKPIYASSLSLEHLDLNLDDAVLADAKVRKALIHATDRRELVEKALGGNATVAHSVIAEASWAHNPSAPRYDVDRERAASLLDEAGWRKAESGFRAKDGRRLTLRFQTTDTEARRRVAAALKEQWRLVGVDLAVEHMKAEEFADRRTGPLGTRRFQVALYSWIGGFDPGVDAHYAYHSTSIPSEKNNFQGGNYPGYEIAEADKLLDQGLAIVDLAERKRLYGEFQRMIMTGVPVIPLFHWPSLTMASDRLLGLKPPIAPIGETWNAWEWDLS